MDAWVAIMVAAIALGGPLFGYLIALRKASGRIDRASDAADLWAEAGAIRKDVLERNRVLEERLKFEEERYMKVREELFELQRRIAGGGNA
jgi:hypothetical protein